MTIDEKINKLAECIGSLTVSVIPIIGIDVANLIGEALNEITEQTSKAEPPFATDTNVVRNGTHKPAEWAGRDSASIPYTPKENEQ